jgi:DNA mismatch endonuclease (patch repair protein)
MRRIVRRDTKPELILRSALHRLGRRYRVDVSTLPGRPDILFTRQRVAVFVHGCFWHQHPGCREASTPKSNQSYWGPKLGRNVERDRENIAALRADGYIAIIAWECEWKRRREIDPLAAGRN